MFHSAIVAGAALASSPAQAETPPLPSAQPTSALSESLVRETKAAIDRGAQWLMAAQQEDGHWSNADFPALTGLAVWSLLGAGYEASAAVSNGIAHILTRTHEDGSIWSEPTAQRKGGGMANYNTAICMVALHLANDPTLSANVIRARQYLAGSQHTGGDEYRGGAGYDPETGRPYADLSNSYMMYEGMALTRSLEDLKSRGDSEDLDWEAAAAFVSQLQNKDGGFIYKPDESKAGVATNQAGEITFRSYGSMTYAGLLSLIYADIDRSDPRIQSALDWASKHWSLDENPGMGREGLYYFYNVLAKSLAAAGQEELARPSGPAIHWRRELIRELLNRQKIDEAGNGYWINEESRWMEADKVLVTSYALIALEVALGE